MAVLLIGSRALAHWYPAVRPPNDYDFFIDIEDFQKWHGQNAANLKDSKVSKTKATIRTLDGVRIEFFFSNRASVTLLINLETHWGSAQPILDCMGFRCHVASPAALLAIKQSHIYWPRFWHKHIADIHFLRQLGVELDPNYQKFQDIRYQEKLISNPPINKKSMNIPNDKFFEQSEKALRRRFVHDDIHKVVMHYDRPLYERTKSDTSKAAIDQILFRNMSIEDQRRQVQEEAYVIALERRLIPVWYTQSLAVKYGLLDAITITPTVVQAAYDYALMRICTTLTGGWFRDFAIVNWPYLKKPGIDFYQLFLDAVAEGRLIPMEGKP